MCVTINITENILRKIHSILRCSMSCQIYSFNFFSFKENVCMDCYNIPIIHLNSNSFFYFKTKILVYCSLFYLKKRNYSFLSRIKGFDSNPFCKLFFFFSKKRKKKKRFFVKHYSLLQFHAEFSISFTIE